MRKDINTNTHIYDRVGRYDTPGAAFTNGSTDEMGKEERRGERELDEYTDGFTSF